MADKITVSSHNSYGSRVKNSLGKIVGGIIFVVASIIGIFLNEKNFLQTKVALNEGAELVKETVSTEINPELDKAEVYLYGETSSPAESLQDTVFGVIVDDLKLARNVSMYQWTEESEEHCTDNVGGSEDCTTTYSYSKSWEDRAINSDNFYESAGHENPSVWQYESQEWEKSPILLGVYNLDSVFVNDLDNYKNLNLTEQEIIVPEEYKVVDTANVETSDSTVEDNNNSYLYGDSENNEEKSNSSKFHIYNDHIYIGESESSPKIGDLRITFSSVKTGTISVVGQQVGNNLTAYTASNGKSIALLENGQVTAEDMFIHAQQANKNMTWIFRVLLLILMYVGFSMMFDFFVTIAKVLPFLSNIIGVGTGLMAFALTLVFGFLAIGISRLAVRPIVGISCLVVVAVGIVMLVRARKNKKAVSTDSKKGDDKDLEIIEA